MAEEKIEIGFQVFLEDGGEECGAVRAIKTHGRPELTIYIENAGDFTIPLEAVRAVHSDKVILDRAKLGGDVLDAIARAHRGEGPGT